MILPVFALFSSVVHAAPAPESRVDDLSPAERHDALIRSFDAHFYPERLGAPPDLDGHGPMCLTPLVAELKASWSLFSADERREMTSHLAPWADDLLHPFPMKADAPPEVHGLAPPPATSACIDPGTVESISDPDGRFLVVWETGSIDEDTAQDFLTALNKGYETEIDELDWREPTGMGRYLMLVYVYDDPRTAGAYTTVEYCSGVGYMPYIVVGSGSFYGGTWYKDMAVHEFNHASQYGYTSERGGINTNVPFWFWESTATWTQEYIYDDNWWSTYVTGYTDTPYVGMEVSDQSNNTEFYHMYGMSVWNFYLDNHIGGVDFVRGLWESAADSADRNLTMEEMIDDAGEDWRETYKGFIATNTIMDYTEQRWFADIDLEDDVESLPAEGESGGRSVPEGLGQNYVRFKRSLGGDDGKLHVSFNGENDISWMVLLVELDGKSIGTVTELEIEEDHGKGEASVTFSGDDDLYLVISPFKYETERNNSGHEYTWTAEWVEDEEPVVEADDTGDGDAGANDTGDGTDDPGKEGDGPLNTDDGSKGGVCGCATGAGSTSSGLGLGLLAGLALVSRRRR